MYRRVGRVGVGVDVGVVECGLSNCQRAVYVRRRVSVELGFSLGFRFSPGEL